MQGRPQTKSPQHPQSSEASPTPDFPHPELDQQRGSPRQSMATSLTINPTPAPKSSTYPFPNSGPHGRQQLLSRPDPRPKLSLNTSTCTPRTLGRGNTGLRLDVLSAHSPTSRNTYKNTYEQPKPLLDRDSFTTSPQATSPSSPKPPTPHPLNDADLSNTRRSSESSTISTDSSISDNSEVTYSIPSHIRPILTNSRLPKRARTTVSSATTPKVFFPPVKRVCFRQPVSEEVRTSIYKLRHSDLLDFLEEEDTPTQPQNPAAYDDEQENTKPTLRLGKNALKSRTQAYEDDDSDDSDETAYPKTPIAGRRKRIRDWRWTLGPLEGAGVGVDGTDAGNADDDQSNDKRSRLEKVDGR